MQCRGRGKTGTDRSVAMTRLWSDPREVVVAENACLDSSRRRFAPAVKSAGERPKTRSIRLLAAAATAPLPGLVGTIRTFWEYFRCVVGAPSDDPREEACSRDARSRARRDC